MHHEQHEGRGGPQGPGGSGGGRRLDGDDDRDHLQATADLWEKAFWQALREARVEMLKAEIKRVWEPSLAPVAKQVAEAMFADWKRFWEKEKERMNENEDPRERIAAILLAGLGKEPGLKG